MIVAWHPCLNGVFASIDGLNLAVQTSSDMDIENATYNRDGQSNGFSCDFKSDFQMIIGLILVPESGQNPLSTLTAPIMHTG